MGKLLPGAKRVLTGESLFMTMFGNGAQQRQKVSFAAPYPGKIIPIDLRAARRHAAVPEGRIPVRGEGHLGRHRVEQESRRRPVRRRGLHPAEARRAGPRVHPRRRHDRVARARGGRNSAARHRLPRRIRAARDLRHPVGRRLQDARCSAAKACSSRRSPGRVAVWLQSLPFSRLAGRMLAAAVASGFGRGADEGSALGGLGMGS